MLVMGSDRNTLDGNRVVHDPKQIHCVVENILYKTVPMHQL